MRMGRTSFLGDIVSAVAGLVAAPQPGEPRRQSMARLRAMLEGRGGLGAFAGTPCSRQDHTATPARTPAAPDDGAEGS